MAWRAGGAGVVVAGRCGRSWSLVCMQACASPPPVRVRVRASPSPAVPAVLSCCPVSAGKRHRMS